MLDDYKKGFIEFCLHKNILTFGEFTLKSGRISPYFFNAGLFNTGTALAKIGNFYAQAIIDAKLDFDMLFGPAYKGIPLACTAAIALSEKTDREIPYCFNRKEVKDHGEGKLLVGAELQGNVLIIDDVITAGTAISQSLPLLQQNNASFAGVAILFDRQERGQGDKSAIDEIKQNHKVPVISIINFADLIEYLKNQTDKQQLVEKMLAYNEKYA